VNVSLTCHECASTGPFAITADCGALTWAACMRCGHAGTPDQFTDAHIADEAASAAVRHIQDALGQDDGGVAGNHFSGQRWDDLTSILLDYIKAERNQS
jgi:hypothetical protein